MNFLNVRERIGQSRDRWVDRSDWGPGPWDGEPDRIEWRDEATGLPCLMLRANPRFGSWCGYVAVPPEHPLHGRDHDDAPPATHEAAHGGLTFAGPCSGEERPDTICHVPLPSEPVHVWWFGFDCGHAFDVSPGIDAFYRAQDPTMPGETYRDAAYVRASCTRLAAALAEIAR